MHLCEKFAKKYFKVLKIKLLKKGFSAPVPRSMINNQFNLLSSCERAVELQRSLIIMWTYFPR